MEAGAAAWNVRDGCRRVEVATLSVKLVRWATRNEERKFKGPNVRRSPGEARGCFDCKSLFRSLRGLGRPYSRAIPLVIEGRRLVLRSSEFSRTSALSSLCERMLARKKRERGRFR